MENKKELDLIIIGGGPAGLSAAVYAARAELNFVVLEKEPMSGGQIINTYEVDNYLGLAGINGFDLAIKFKEHCEKLGVIFQTGMIKEIETEGLEKKVVLSDGTTMTAKTLLLATGAKHRMLGVKGEKELTGFGVSYCATCDGALYKGKTIAVVSTAKRFEHEVAFLAELAEKVYFFPYYKDCEIERENVELVNKPIKEVKGGFRVEELVLKDETSKKVDGVFIMRNAIAPTTLLNTLEVEDGHIVVNRQMETNLKGVYAAGDCTGKPYQYAKSVGEGNVAAHSVIEYLGEK